MINASVIITTWCRKDMLKKIIQNLIYGSFITNKYEIIVCDSGSQDGTEQLVKSFISKYPKSNIKIIQANNSIAYKRNAGIRESIGEYLIFIDDDCLPENDFIAKHVNFLKSCKIKSIVGGLVLYPEISLFLSKSYICYKKTRHHLSNQLCGSSYTNPNKIVAMNLCVKKKDIIADNLYFNEKIASYGLEDYDYAKRCLIKGYKLYINNAAIYHYEIKANFKSFSNKICELSNKAMPALINHTDYNLRDLPFYIIEKNFVINFIARNTPKCVSLAIMKFTAKLYDMLPKVSNNMVRLLIVFSYIVGIQNRT
jgi:GT2 family glycosyltransferase